MYIHSFIHSNWLRRLLPYVMFTLFTCTRPPSCAVSRDFGGVSVIPSRTSSCIALFSKDKQFRRSHLVGLHGVCVMCTDLHTEIWIVLSFCWRQSSLLFAGGWGGIPCVVVPAARASECQSAAAVLTFRPTRPHATSSPVALRHLTLSFVLYTFVTMITRLVIAVLVHWSTYGIFTGRRDGQLLSLIISLITG